MVTNYFDKNKCLLKIKHTAGLSIKCNNIIEL